MSSVGLVDDERDVPVVADPGNARHVAAPAKVRRGRDEHCTDPGKGQGKRYWLYRLANAD